MFDDSNLLIPYQLSGDCLGVSNEPTAGGSSDETTSKEDAEKQMLQYNPTLDFSELLDNSLDEPLSTGRSYSSKLNCLLHDVIDKLINSSAFLSIYSLIKCGQQRKFEHAAASIG